MKAFITSLAIGFGLAVHGGSASAQTSHDDEIRAAMVLNFARFAEWPTTRFTSEEAPVVLCVDEAERLAPALANLDGQDVSGRLLAVRQAPASEFDPRCHVAVIAPSSQSPGAVARLHDMGVLTIGDDNNFSDFGAIELVQVGRQVRFEINNSVARGAGVQLSSRLLRLAVAVR